MTTLTITGGGAIYAYTSTVASGGVTAINAGTVGTSGGYPGILITGSNARLIDNPGAVFIGSISGGSGGTAVPDLTSGSSTGTIVGLGTSVTNFTSPVFDTGAQWTAAGDDATELPFSGVTIGDPDRGATQAVTITVTAGDWRAMPTAHSPVPV